MSSTKYIHKWYVIFITLRGIFAVNGSKYKNTIVNYFFALLLLFVIYFFSGKSAVTYCILLLFFDSLFVQFAYDWSDGTVAMMANWGTIMFLLFVAPLSWFIEVREYTIIMMANWRTIMFLLFVILLSWFLEV